MSIIIDNQEVQSIKVGNDNVYMVDYNGTAIWNNFASLPWVGTEINGTVTDRYGTFNYKMGNIAAVGVSVDMPATDVVIDAYVKARIYFDPGTYYTLSFRCQNSGALSSEIITSSVVNHKNKTIYTDSMKNHGFDRIGLHANLILNENFQVSSDNIQDNIQMNRKQYFCNDYPKLYIATIDAGSVHAGTGSNVNYKVIGVKKFK